MGFRFRKSINLGGGFKVNLSKSGIGYSWGTKGYRVTKTSRGTTRRTASIPGTGISYVSESGKRKRGLSSTPTSHNQPKDVHTNDEINTYDTHEIKNAVATDIVSEGLENMLATATKALKLRKLSLVCFWIFLVLGIATPPLLLLAAASFVAFVVVKTKGVIDISYTFEDEQATLVSERMAPLHKISKSHRIWYLTQTSKVVDKKYAAGASNLIKRDKCTISKSLPFPFKTNADSMTFLLGKEKLLFLPDKLFVIQGTKIGALNYSDVITSVEGYRFIEEEGVPKDAKIVGQTWKYVNQKGGPDKRFSDNKQLPICLYGKMIVKSDSGLNTSIVFSNIDIQ